MFKDIEHLVRLAAVMLIVFLGFVILRTAIVPRSFGQYGHYRGAAIAEIASRPIVHAGHAACEGCHSDVMNKKQTGRHVKIACETCHGALAAHADDPSVTPPQVDTGVLCARCHEANGAKPKWFPQVATADHSGGLPCDTCHQPHAPKIESNDKTGGKK